MSLVRLLGFSTLACGCVIGRYLELSGAREVAYVEEKGDECANHLHRRNHSVPRLHPADDDRPPLGLVAAAKVS